MYNIGPKTDYIVAIYLRTPPGFSPGITAVVPPLTQGISFLDAMSEMWVRKGWHKGQLDGLFRVELLQWLDMLLLLVPITDSSTVPMLKKILNPKQEVLANQEFRSSIIQQVFGGK